jgi:hypothetical protein
MPDKKPTAAPIPRMMKMFTDNSAMGRYTVTARPLNMPIARKAGGKHQSGK